MVPAPSVPPREPTAPEPAGPEPQGQEPPHLQAARHRQPADLSELFRTAFRHHAAGVAILTAVWDGVPYGFTATSLASLSADPPRFTFNMALSASSWPAVANGEYVGVHLLGLDHAGLATRFARGPDRFSGDHWEPGPFGIPLLKDVRGWLLGRILLRLSFGSNAVVVAEVVDGGIGPDGHPLLYHGGSYHRAAALEYEI